MISEADVFTLGSISHSCLLVVCAHGMVSVRCCDSLQELDRKAEVGGSGLTAGLFQVGNQGVIQIVDELLPGEGIAVDRGDLRLDMFRRLPAPR